MGSELRAENGTKGTKNSYTILILAVFELAKESQYAVKSRRANS